MEALLSPIIGCWLGFFLVIIFHEMGHALMGKRNGYRVTSVIMGFGKPLLRWRWNDVIYSISATKQSGLTMAYPIGLYPEPKQERAFYAGGLIAQLPLMALEALLLVFNAPYSLFWLMLLFTNALVFIVNLSPSSVRIGGGNIAMMTDGYRLFARSSHVEGSLGISMITYDGMIKTFTKIGDMEGAAIVQLRRIAVMERTFLSSQALRDLAGFSETALASPVLRLLYHEVHALRENADEASRAKLDADYQFFIGKSDSEGLRTVYELELAARQANDEGLAELKRIEDYFFSKRNYDLAATAYRAQFETCIKLGRLATASQMLAQIYESKLYLPGSATLLSLQRSWAVAQTTPDSAKLALETLAESTKAAYFSLPKSYRAEFIGEASEFAEKILDRFPELADHSPEKFGFDLLSLQLREELDVQAAREKIQACKRKNVRLFAASAFLLIVQGALAFANLNFDSSNSLRGVAALVMLGVAGSAILVVGLAFGAFKQPRSGSSALAISFLPALMALSAKALGM